MRIVFDISTSWNWRQHAVGIVRTERELLRRFLTSIESGALVEDNPPCKSVNTTIAFCRYAKKNKTYVRASKQEVEKTLSEDWIARPVTVSSISSWLKEQLLPMASFQFDRNDVYVSVGNDWFHNNYEVLRKHRKTAGFKCVLYVHDLIPILYPHLTTLKTEQRFRQHVIDLCRTADSIVAVSNCTARDLRSFIATAQIEMQVPVYTVPSGDDMHDGVVEAIDSLKLADFFMYVSTIEARKNHAVLLKAWELLYPCQQLQGRKLVLVGKAGWGTVDLMSELRRNPYLKDRTIVASDLSDGQLNWLYKHAKFTVFPSLYEGWGLPAAESLRFGKAVVVSDAPSLSEATQNLMPVTRSHDIEGWSNSIKRLFLDQDYRRSLEQKARLEYKPRSWNDYFDEILKVIKATVSGDRQCGSIEQRIVDAG